MIFLLGMTAAAALDLLVFGKHEATNEEPIFIE